MSLPRSILNVAFVHVLLCSVCLAQETDNTRVPELRLGDAVLAGTKREASVMKFNPGLNERGQVMTGIFNQGNLKKYIQIAFVIDGTETMQNEIEQLGNVLVEIVNGLKKSVEDVRQGNQVTVEIAIVVYSDIWRAMKDANGQLVRDEDGNPVYPDQPDQKQKRSVKLESKDRGGFGGFFMFARDLDRIRGTLERIADKKNLVYGGPGLPEQADRGLHAALTELDWKPPGSDVSRLILMAGDVSPWPEAFLEGGSKPDWFNGREPQALRGYMTEDLIKEAQKKQITIHAIVCQGIADNYIRSKTEGDYSLKAQFGKDWMRYFDSATRRTARDIMQGERDDFFGTLSARTGGAYLDLRNPETAKRILRILDGKQRQRPVQELESIRDADIQRLRYEWSEATEFPTGAVSVAVLPPAENLRSVTFDWDVFESAEQPRALAIADEIILRLKRIDTEHVRKRDRVGWVFKDVLKQVPMNADAGNDKVFLAALVKRLDVDFVIWGELTQDGDQSKLQLRLYDANGSLAAEGDVVESAGELLVKNSFASLARSMEHSKSTKVQAFKSYYSDVLLQQTAVAKGTLALEQLLTANDLLIHAAQYSGEDGAAGQLNMSRLNMKARDLLEGSLASLASLAKSCPSAFST